MTSAVARLIWFVATPLALLLTGEWAARRFEPSFAAVSNRVRFKAALLERQGPIELLFVGTSRLNDGLSPAQLTARLGAKGGLRGARGFNASTPSSSLETLAFLVRGGLSHPGLKVLVLELSAAQTRSEALSLDPPAEEGLLRGSNLLRYRRALALENLPRFLGLALARRFDGSEWFRDRWLLEGAKERLGSLSPAPPIVEPRRVESAPLAAAPLEAAGAEAASTYQRLSDEAAAAGVRTFWVVPPSAATERSAECVGEFQRLVGEVARRTRAPVLDYSCVELPASFFADGRTHLGAAGRAWFSASIADQLADVFRTGAADALH